MSGDVDSSSICAQCGRVFSANEEIHAVVSHLPPLMETVYRWPLLTKETTATFDGRVVCDVCWTATQKLTSYVRAHPQLVTAGTDGVRVLMGPITLASFEDEGEALAVGDEYLARFLEEWHETMVYAVYGFSDEPLTPHDMAQAAIEIASGIADATLHSHYSEITGYLWTDEDGRIGGHDMVGIFSRNQGKYGCLVISPNPLDLMDLGQEYFL